MSTTPQGGRSTIESIVQELKKIPEPMQLSLLDFIRSLGSNYPVAATTQNEAKLKDQKHYPLRGMPIQIEPDFDEPMTDLWMALGE
jgi:Protein of unknown function (DUF2281)